MPPSIPNGISILDLIVAPVVFLLILIIGFFIQSKQKNNKSYFRFFLQGLLVKLLGALALCIVYMYYYTGGDTLNYFYSAEVMTRLLFVNFKVFYDITVLGDLSPSNLSAFTIETGTPLYRYDFNSFQVVRLTTPLVLVAFRSYIATSFIIAAISFSGIWKLFTIFAEQFPKLERQMALAFLFLPSVFFWGSGILKDTITLASVGWFTYCVYQIINKGRKNISIILISLLSSYLLLSIKPYLFYALVPSSALLALLSITSKVSSVFIRIIIFPITLLLIGFSAYFLLVQVGNEKDRGSKFSLNNVMSYAVTVQQDLKREEYKGSTFDIGNFDASFGSMASKAPQAINGALFRPYFWEATNPVMLFSSIENAFLLILTIRILYKLKLVNFFRMLTKDPLLLFSITFAILIAFAVGISTSNFGTLVRYKIPALPFYVATVYAVQYLYETSKKKPEQEQGPAV